MCLLVATHNHQLPKEKFKLTVVLWWTLVHTSFLNVKFRAEGNTGVGLQRMRCAKMVLFLSQPLPPNCLKLKSVVKAEGIVNRFFPNCDFSPHEYKRVVDNVPNCSSLLEIPNLSSIQLEDLPSFLVHLLVGNASV